MIVQISAGQGPSECQLAVAKLFAALKREYEDLEVISETEGYEKGCLDSIRFRTAQDLSDLEGTVLWICRSPFRPNHKRKNWYVDVNVIPSKNNPHAHIMVTDRPTNANGFCSKKNRDWNKKERIYKWRKLWEEVQNNFFAEKEMEVRVSHRSLEAQGIDREPTRPLGREAAALERKGIRTENGNINREIEARRKAQEQRRAYQKERKRKRDKTRSR